MTAVKVSCGVCGRRKRRDSRRIRQLQEDTVYPPREGLTNEITVRAGEFACAIHSTAAELHTLRQHLEANR